jgi:phenol 2-monooxygenase
VILRLALALSLSLSLSPHTKCYHLPQRVPPQIVLCSADTRPYELQDLLPSDARLKLLLLTGNTNDPKQRERIEAVADKLNTLVLTKFTPPGEKFGKVFDIITIRYVGYFI